MSLAKSLSKAGRVDIRLDVAVKNIADIHTSPKIFINSLIILFFFTDVDDIPDDHTGGDSSKSNSVTSEHSVHSVGVSASSQSSSTNSLPAGEHCYDPMKFCRESDF